MRADVSPVALPRSLLCRSLRRAVSTVLSLMWALCAGPPIASALESPWVNSGQANARLLTSKDQMVAGESIWLALELELPDGWHTYWRNPGDSGAPPTLDYSLPKGVSLGQVHWVPPEIIPFGPLVNLGYKKRAFYAQPLKLPPDFEDEYFDIQLQGRWLVCEAVCIPERAELSLRLPVKVGSIEDTSERDTSGRVGRSLTRGDPAAWLSDLQTLWPKPLPGASVHMKQNQVVVRLPASVAPVSEQAKLTYLPYTAESIDLTRAQKWQASSSSDLVELILPVDLDEAVDMSGVILFEEIVAGKTLRGAFEVVHSVQPVEGPDSLTVLTAMLFAFLGGLILNLMPCVFPVLSIKVLGLIESSSRRSSFAAGFSYGVGVVVSFLALALLLVILRELGENLGWGFQLQWPWMVGVLALIFVLLGLNLSGFFDMGLGMQTFAGNLQAGQNSASRMNSFWTGVLAVVVAAPCTAPFMGAALGYAMTQPLASTFAIFFALGVGMAAPMTLLASYPKLLSGLPKPGPWMVRLKEVLAFPMYFSALWLVWVLSEQTGGLGLLIWGSIFIGSVFLIWLGQQAPSLERVLWLVALLVLPLGFAQLETRSSLASDPLLQGAPSPSGSLVYSDEAVRAALANGHPVFVDFTADWCITCKVNERLAIQAAATQALFDAQGVVVLVADWTNEDASITQALARFGRVGVPLYLLYRPGEQNPQILPQLLTPDVIREALIGDANTSI